MVIPNHHLVTSNQNPTQTQQTLYICYVNWSKTAAIVLPQPPFNCNFLTTSPPHSHFKAILRSSSFPAHSHIIPWSLPDHSQVTPRSFPLYSHFTPRFWAITSSFLVHSWFTPRSFPCQSKFVPRSFPTYSQIFPAQFKDFGIMSVMSVQLCGVQ